MFSCDQELDDHLKRHLSTMCNSDRTNIDIMRWLISRGHEVEIKCNGKNSFANRHLILFFTILIILFLGIVIL